MTQSAKRARVQLDALVASNLRTEAEVADIEARTLAAAGNAYAGADLLAMQQAERLKLEAECKQLEAELAQSELADGSVPRGDDPRVRESRGGVAGTALRVSQTLPGRVQ